MARSLVHVYSLQRVPGTLITPCLEIGMNLESKSDTHLLPRNHLLMSHLLVVSLSRDESQEVSGLS